MRTAEKEILRDVLGRMADEAPEPVPLEELHTVLALPEAMGRDRWLTRRPVWVAAVVATAVLVLGAGVSLLTNTGGDDIYVADGETLISADPPIVQGAESPEPEFDTSGLGDEVPLAPVTDSLRIVEAATTLQTGGLPGEIIRITVLGETPEGVLALIVHAEGEDLRGNPIQLRCQTTTLGGTQTCGGGLDLEEVADMPGGLIPAQPGGGPNYTVGEAPDDHTMIWEVPPETSVVTLTVNDETRWQRPVAGVAVFITDLVFGDRFELAAFDARGNTLDSVSVVTRHPDQ